MDGSSDPFGPMDADTTWLTRPMPGGRAAPAQAPPAPPDRPREPTPPRPPHRAGSVAAILGTPGRGPLVECAFGLLSVVPLLRAHTPPAPPAQIRVQLEEELRVFADRAQSRGVEQRQVALGHYALCALLDDAVLNTPWGAHGTWRSSSLAGALHHDAAAGEHFFGYLEQARRHPERSRPVLELMGACLALGFQGRYRIAPQRRLPALQQIRRDVLATLRRLDGAGEGEDLSPHWRGAALAPGPAARRIPLWVSATGALTLLGLAYAALLLGLGAAGERLDAAIAALPPASPVAILRSAAAETPALTPVPVPADSGLEAGIRACLAKSGYDEPGAVGGLPEGLRLRLPDAGLFASGSAELRPTVQPLLLCLAESLKGAEGRVAILGHTDDRPMRTPRFPNNWELSLARAEAVAAVLRPMLGGERLRVFGRADTEPVAPNYTEAGRSRNRRVEVLLLR
ncbi:type IVB secretion system protein IcmH/DotU [Belnapia sp. T6]|uniref:Type IVB secretion system protein IcmH/DotU n=1 Tax=Belnapia mucosa TaxID=2804532 RepID=A0ABS1VAH8_9PROT|nr:type IVB secretion system protein IcmH/DotU [Belnapia mucosa]MBL6458658.1 type IVB secretion system protein IcmH/DotU [Belnapia mucosa]